MRALHTAIGKTVSVQLLDPGNGTPDGAPAPLRIVGTVATPQFYFTQSGKGNAAVVSDEFILSKGLPASQIDSGAFIRFAPGISLDRGVARIKELAPGAFTLRRSESSDLANLAGISNLPNIGAGLIALVAAGTLVHTLVSSVRRRRRDFAILRALGFVRRQVRLTVVWQATTIILISLALGLPLGAVAGRQGWRVFVGQLGYVPLAIVPLVQVLLMIPIAIVLANVIGSIPARAAARTQPVEGLRAE
jgi:ABC-type antimicrobial peptide transport system permease subunit